MSKHASPTSLKRKRSALDDIELDKRPFAIRLDSTDPFARPPRFTPLCLLARAQLPLAYLDTTRSGPRLFAAHLHVLEQLHDDGERYMILLAREEEEDRLYAVERVERKKYALCRLARWVKESDLLVAAEFLAQSDELLPKRQALRPVENGQPWWTRASVSLPVSSNEGSTNGPVPRLDLRGAANSSPKVQGSLQKSTHTTIDENDAIGEGSNTAIISGPDQEPSQNEPSNPLQELSKQYLEALYLSRTSLAYFSKGPLSRARAAFTGDNGETAVTELIDFLRQTILVSTTMDKKYRDGISEVIKTLPLAGVDHSAKRKRKRKWKAKRDKAGLMVDEKDYVARWWHELDTLDTRATETGDDTLRRRLPEIRKRETFLQVILVLEILALERAHLSPNDQQPDQQPASAEPRAERDGPALPATSATPSKPRPKKKVDLPTLLETLLDRLCIWSSLDAISPAKKSDSADQQAPSSENDILKNFCIEVVIPFYVQRVPQHAGNVNKKLGGPSAPSPVKRKAAASSKPGEPALRRPPRKEVTKSSATSTSQPAIPAEKRQPSLSRSASYAEAPPPIKRETSEIPLETIPAVKPSNPVARRQQRTSLMHSLSFTKREVDLSAMSQANEAKMRRKADIQAKMQEAISNIKKPNRALAVQDIAASTDESFARATAKARANHSQSQGQSQSQRGGGGAAKSQSVHVAATPKHTRTTKSTPYRRPAQHDVSSGPSVIAASSAKPKPQPGELPSHSNAFAVPQTGHRSRHTVASHTNDKINNSNDIAETPSRGFAKFLPAGLAREPGTLESSPIATRRSAIPSSAAAQATPSRPVRKIAFASALAESTARSAELVGGGHGDGFEVGATPVRPSRAIVDATPVRFPRPNKEALGDASPNAEKIAQTSKEGKSIYASLGWDEEEYEELG